MKLRYFELMTWQFLGMATVLAASLLTATNGLGEHSHSVDASAEGKTVGRTHEWTDKSGRRVSAKLVSVADTEVVLQTGDGKLYTVPLSNLSDDDRAFIDTNICYRIRLDSTKEGWTSDNLSFTIFDAKGNVKRTPTFIPLAFEVRPGRPPVPFEVQAVVMGMPEDQPGGLEIPVAARFIPTESELQAGRMRFFLTDGTYAGKRYRIAVAGRDARVSLVSTGSAADVSARPISNTLTVRLPGR